MRLTYAAVLKMAEDKGLRLFKTNRKDARYGVSYYNFELDSRTKFTQYAKTLDRAKEIIEMSNNRCIS